MTFDKRVGRQTATVARLARELHFELLMLGRMKRRQESIGEAKRPELQSPRRLSMGDVYAAAVLRHAADNGNPPDAPPA